MLEYVTRTVIVLLVCLLIVGMRYQDLTQQKYRCDSLFRTGRWSFDYDPHGHSQWQPYGVMTPVWNVKLISKCLNDTPLFLVGDSTVLEVFWAIVEKVDGEDAVRASTDPGEYQDLEHHAHNANIRFAWDPYLNATKTIQLLNVSHERNSQLVISTGVWHVQNSGKNFIEDYKACLRGLATLAAKSSSTFEHPTIVLPPPHMNHNLLNPERAMDLNKKRLEAIVDALAIAKSIIPGLEVAWSARLMTHDFPADVSAGGLRVSRGIAGHQADVILNRVCNKQFQNTNKVSSFACVPRSEWKWSQMLIFVLWIGTLIGRVLVAQNNQSVYKAVATILSIAIYCLVADRTLMLEKLNKLISQQLFIFSALALLFAGSCLIKRIPYSTDPAQFKSRQADGPPASLSRCQTDEWKGWMQIVILLYHYFGMSNILWVYRTIRVLVGCYLFLTGYGHARYFQKTRDFSFKRVIAVLLRLNLLACLLSIVMDNNYDFYYFPGLASIWFLITYATFWGSRGPAGRSKDLWLRIAVSLLAVRGLLSWRYGVESILQGLHVLRGPSIDPKEFLFRVTLDAYSPFLGMLVSVLQEEKLTLPLSQRLSNAWRTRRPFLAAFTATVALAIYEISARRFADKYAYNRWHSLLSLLPIVAYAILRNVHPAASRYYAPLFAAVGTFSLELFVLQYHIWLAGDTKGILHLGIIDSPRFAQAGTTVAASWTFWLECALVTMSFSWVSYVCANSTNTIVKAFVNCQLRTLQIRTAVLLGALWTYNIVAA